MSQVRIAENKPVQTPYELPPSCVPESPESTDRYVQISSGKGTVCIPVASPADVPHPSDRMVHRAWNDLVSGGGRDGVRTGLTLQDTAYRDSFGLDPSLNAELIPEEEIREMWNQVVQKSNEQAQKQIGQQQSQCERDKVKKLELLLMLALNSGDMDLAMLLFSSLETKQSNAVSGNLLQKLQELQSQRRDYADQMAKLDPNKKEDAKTVTDLQQKIGDVNTTMQTLQLFLQEITSQKNESQTMASNFLKGRSEVGMSIARNIG